jgi:molybdate transport system substrate-binding protein
MRHFTGFVLAALLWALPLQAAEIAVVAVTPVGPAVQQLAEQFKTASGHDVKVQVVGTGQVGKVIASSGAFDILIATTAIVDQALKDGRTAAPKTYVGRVGIGVVVGAGAKALDLSTVDAFRRELLAADWIVFNTAGSGQYVASVLEKMGLTEQLKGKIPAPRPTTAAQTFERVLQSKNNEIGFGMISEVKPYEAKGLRLAGPLPDGLQNYTVYDAAVTSGSKSAAPAADFIRFLTTPAARKVFAATGVE